jgi:protein O-GlcNAc transferase
LHTERLYRMADSQWCYVPWYDAKPVAVPHADRSEALVFGSFNQANKIGDAALDIWCRVLRVLPEAELVVLDFSEERARRTLLEKLARRGIEATRVTIRGRERISEYLQAIANVDIALDPFPYNGATTTLDTLWMGTPIVALEGDRGVARGSCSILRTLDVPELIASTADEFVEINVRLARDITWRRALRASLRSRLTESPLMDAPKFVAGLESAYQKMWHDWCLANP